CARAWALRMRAGSAGASGLCGGASARFPGFPAVAMRKARAADCSDRSPGVDKRPAPSGWTPAAGTASADVVPLVLVLAALLLGAPAHAGDDGLGSVAKQPSLWDRMKAIDRSMQHDAEHPESMGHGPGTADDAPAH